MKAAAYKLRRIAGFELNALRASEVLGDEYEDERNTDSTFAASSTNLFPVIRQITTSFSNGSRRWLWRK